MTITEDNMKSRRSTWSQPLTPLILAAVVMACALPNAPAQAPAARQAAPKGALAFDTAQQAADALVKAAGAYDVPQLLAIFGPDGEDLVSSADPVRDKNNGAAFAADAGAKLTLDIKPSNPNLATLIVGEKEWPVPVPIVKRSGKWYFDAKAGKQEVLFRRIGANELDAIQVCRGYVEAQEDYAATIHDDSGVNQYAQKIFSSPGKQDGLYWKNPDGTSGGPIGEAVAKALAEGYSATEKSAFHGYYFKILKGQGPAAPMGRLDYVIEGIMIGGFALVAVPAEYRVTGVKTFMVSNGGGVYQKDLGPDSLKIVQEMELYNPDKTWQATDDEWPASVADGETEETKP